MITASKRRLRISLILSIAIAAALILGIRISKIINTCHAKELLRLYDKGIPDTPIQHHHDTQVTYERREADRLYEDVRVLCWVLTAPKYHQVRAKHVKATWGKRCNKLIFMSTEEDSELGAVALNVKEGWSNLWEKTKAAFQYIYENHLDDADWILKADDDSFVVVENLRYMLSPYNSKDPIWFGSRVIDFPGHGYMSGGAGYVVSKETMIKLVTEGLPNPEKCGLGDQIYEDVELALCMDNIGIKGIDTRDYMGRQRFLPLVPSDHFFPGVNGARKRWYSKNTFYPYQNGIECCSDNVISFHYVPPHTMYELEYYIYHLNTYGLHINPPFPAPLPPDRSGIPKNVLEGAK